jgi:capsid protein
VNWIDRAVTFVSPEAGLRRLRARAALNVVRSYDAGKTTRRTSGWSSSGTSANSEALPSLATVRNRSRELVRNNPHALRAINVLTAKSIGSGIKARWDKGAAAAWKEFEDTCDYEGDQDLCGLQTLAARGSFESGEVIIRRVREKSGRVPLKLQLLEPDYLDSLKFGPAQNGNFIIAGVEIDQGGRKVAYYLYDQHPGEIVTSLRPLISKRVPASEVILFGEKLRPGQIRYMARLAASMMRLRDFDDYRDALIVKKKIEACFAAFVIGGTPSTPLGEATTDSSTGIRTETLSPGIIEYVNGGQDVKFANPEHRHRRRLQRPGAARDRRRRRRDLRAAHRRPVRRQLLIHPRRHGGLPRPGRGLALELLHPDGHAADRRLVRRCRLDGGNDPHQLLRCRVDAAGVALRQPARRCQRGQAGNARRSPVALREDSRARL